MRERLLAVTHGLAGELSLDAIACVMGRSRATIQTWFDAYRKGGVAQLCSLSETKRGAKGLMTAPMRKALHQKVAKGSFRRVQDAHEWLVRKFGVDVKVDTVGRWLGKLGARLKVVRPRHPQSSETRRFEFRSQLARQMFSVLREHGAKNFRQRPLRIWVADEARFGLHPCHRRAWVARGVRAHKSSRCQYHWQHVWAALQVGGSGSEFYYSNKVDADLSGEFLKQISRRDPWATHVVIWDGAGYHPRNGDERIPDNVVVLRQPPYSPELNPVERLWDQLRDGLCNRNWRCLDQLLEAATRWLKEFWEDPRRIFSLIGRGWMLQQANA
jgi:transposase